MRNSTFHASFARGKLILNQVVCALVAQSTKIHVANKIGIYVCTPHVPNNSTFLYSCGKIIFTRACLLPEMRVDNHSHFYHEYRTLFCKRSMRNSPFCACFVCAKYLFYTRRARKSRMRRSIYFRARRV